MVEGQARHLSLPVAGRLLQEVQGLGHAPFPLAEDAEEQGGLGDLRPAQGLGEVRLHGLQVLPPVRQGGAEAEGAQGQPQEPFGLVPIGKLLA